jgi:O-methyltransferase
MNPASLIAPNILHELLETARAAPPGDFVEVGVYQGGSAAYLAEAARESGRRLFLFDTFAGIPHANPEQGDAHKVGDFCDTSPDAVRAAIPEAIIRVGVFPDTLTDDVGPIALAHIDCDQFQSVRDCCIELAPRMVAGGVMIFDDYDCLEGARHAVDACFGERVEKSAEGKARVYF